MLSELQLITLLEDLERKVVRLSFLYQDTRQRAQDLENQYEALQEKLLECQNQLKQAQKKAADVPESFPKSKDFGKIVSDKLTSTVSNAELTQQLDAYIDEIDRCIAQLSKLS